MNVFPAARAGPNLYNLRPIGFSPRTMASKFQAPARSQEPRRRFAFYIQGSGIAMKIQSFQSSGAHELRRELAVRMHATHCPVVKRAARLVIRSRIKI